MTLDKPKTSFSFQGAPGSNSLLFFSFLFSCLLSEGGRRRKSTSPLQNGHGVIFLFHTLWAAYQRPHPAVPVRTLWEQLPGAGQCHCGEVSLPWDGSWQLVLPPWREQMSLCRGAAQPSHTALWRGLLGKAAQGGFEGGGWCNPVLQPVAPQRPLPHLAVVIRAGWPGRGRAQRGWCQDKALSG